MYACACVDMDSVEFVVEFVQGSVHVVHTQTHPQCYILTSYELMHNMSYMYLLHSEGKLRNDC